MMYIVTKMIVTPTRRIPAGSIIRAEYIDGPLSEKEWLRLGFLASNSSTDDAPEIYASTQIPVEMPADLDTE